MTHPLDLATQLTELGEGHYQGLITPAYANMVGPFGGAIAAVMLKGVLQHPALLGEPASLTVNFAGPISAEPFEIVAHIKRTNRSTQHWSVELLQAGEVAITATVLTAVRRAGWSTQELKSPNVPEAAAVKVNNFGNVTPWVSNYQMQFIEGFLTFNKAQAGDSSLSQLWVRDNPARALDYVSLTALSDVFFPRIFIRKQQPLPAGTVSMTLNFHTDAEVLAEQGSEPVLACAQANQFFNGYADQSAQLFAKNGHLLVTSTQLVYYKA